jgi:hypothetical protein
MAADDDRGQRAASGISKKLIPLPLPSPLSDVFLAQTRARFFAC